jgi:hypothetical protein
MRKRSSYNGYLDAKQEWWMTAARGLWEEFELFLVPDQNMFPEDFIMFYNCRLPEIGFYFQCNELPC